MKKLLAILLLLYPALAQAQTAPDQRPHAGQVCQTNKANSFLQNQTFTSIQGVTVGGTTGTGNLVFSSGPSLTNPVVGTQSASDNSTKGASTAYVTAAINTAIAGVNPAVAVQAATTQASDTSGLTYHAVAAGIGDTFTGSTNTAVTIDGYTFTALGQRLLVKNDTQSPSGAFNGVYYVTQVQTAILPPIFTRALDYDQSSDINNTGAIPVVNGTANSSTSWLLTSSVTNVGTDPLTYIKFSINPTTVQTTALTNTHVWIGNGSNLAVDVALSGGATVSNTGTVTLGNPGASTLGGIDSYAAVSHQWINAIGTNGLPASTQPAFTDISGTETTAQQAKITQATQTAAWQTFAGGL